MLQSQTSSGVATSKIFSLLRWSVFPTRYRCRDLKFFAKADNSKEYEEANFIETAKRFGDRILGIPVEYERNIPLQGLYEMMQRISVRFV